jgi:hypothetical protein
MSSRSQLFVGAALGYADAQAFGYAALFGMVVDLKLYDLTAAGLNLHKYSFASAMPQLGSLVVSGWRAF